VLTGAEGTAFLRLVSAVHDPASQKSNRCGPTSVRSQPSTGLEKTGRANGVAFRLLPLPQGMCRVSTTRRGGPQARRRGLDAQPAGEPAVQRAFAAGMLSTDPAADPVYFVDDHFVAYTGARPVGKGWNTKPSIVRAVRSVFPWVTISLSFVGRLHLWR